jgi:hypothetical protein
VTDPAPQRPVPGPPRPVPGPVPGRPVAPAQDAGDALSTEASGDPETSPFAGLADRPVAEHVAVYEAEHERLQRELSTIDQL